MQTKMNTKALWKFQHDSIAVHEGYATDARGLKLRKDCGYTHVNRGDGWLQIEVAIRKLAVMEQIAKTVGA